MLLPTAHARGSQCGRICNANYCLFDGCPMHPTAHVHNLAGHYTRSCIYFHYHTDLHANAVLPCAVGKSMCPQIQVVLHGVPRRALQEVFITACSWGTNVDIAHAIHRLSIYGVRPVICMPTSHFYQRSGNQIVPKRFECTAL